MKDNKLYSLMLPVWYMLVFPITWLIVIPTNFLIYTLVLFTGFRLFKVDDKNKVYKKTILKVFLVGFLADLIGCLFLLLTHFVSKQGSLYDAIKMQTVWSPLENIWTILILVLSILVSMFCAYVLNYRFSFKKAKLERKTAKKLAALVALFTAPWILLFPCQMLYKSTSQNYSDSMKIRLDELKSNEIKNVLNEIEGSTYIKDGVFNSTDLRVSVNCNVNTSNNDEVKKYEELFESNSTDKLLNENATKIFNKVNYIDNIVFIISNDKTYTFNRNNVK